MDNLPREKLMLTTIRRPRVAAALVISLLAVCLRTEAQGLPPAPPAAPAAQPVEAVPEGAYSADVVAAINRAKADIARTGWHLVVVGGEDGAPGFIYTVGLWQRYRHPELMIVAPDEKPEGFVGNLTALAKRVATGEALKPNVPIEGAFGKHKGVARQIHENWYPSFLGIAGAVYNSFDFPALQVYWPDRQGLYAWEAQADPELFRVQPLLDQENPIFANLGQAEIGLLLEEEGGKQRFDAGLQELFVPVPKEIDLLEFWRWLVGNDVTVFKVTLFGDMILADKNGELHWLDIGYGTFEALGVTKETWLPAFYEVAFEWVRVRLLLELKAAGIELKPAGVEPSESYVYDWIRAPMLGGAITKGNVQRITLHAAATAAGQIAEHLHKKRAQAKAPSSNGTKP